MIIRKLTLLFLFLFTGISSAQLLFKENATAKGAGYAYGSSVFGGGVSFADFNNDGWDDLTYATDETKEVLFFQNNNGTFNLVDLGINDTYRVKQVIWVDYDNDGDKDFLATSITGFNKFYRNDDNMSFTDITSSCGLFTDNQLTYGATFGDLDNDGWFDIYVTHTAGNNLLKNNGDGTFTDVATTTETSFDSIAWGAVFLDADNDSELDLYVSGMLDGSDPNKLPSAFYHNQGGSYIIPNNIGFVNDTRSSFGNAIGDFNNDGLADIVVMNNSNENNFLWENQTTTTNNWIKIKLEGV